ncbi:MULTISPECIES: ash family protein [Enterobacter cloacae complex]|uniref:ash family protein n=1 Tax=Enterobacter cloacae complex TaxID=354276 RepID=UPI001E38D599|nr:ash family protein [Enterobacter hormaechei]MCW4757070.1 ash family protein [Enterobacter hormaechei subsp. xiangfangensis]MCW4796718.1 ash family protein [Enterobacter hormaechei subsp. xiangfangensis]MCW4970242.1 ash family protein [Enterobacter hormaechei subsp. xiangfangensis]MDF3644042.1 ash family protein [Enterobacter hormaechei]
MCHSNQALAKSSAGIGVPDNYKGAYTARAVFLCVLYSKPVSMVGCVGAPKGAPGPL